MLVRRLAPLLALACLLAAAPPAGARSSATLTTKITKEAITGKRATFWFRAAHTSGTAAVGFFCNLEWAGHVVGPFRSCVSPRHYYKLSAGSYTFYVYAVQTNGTKSASATYAFTVA